MKPRPRIRKTVKWGGAAVTMLLGVLWIGSGWYWWPGVRWRNVDLSVGHGQASITHFVDDLSGPLNSACGLVPGPGVESLYAQSFDLKPWFGHHDTVGLYGTVRIPLWTPVALALLVTVAAWRLDIVADRRARLNLCPKCHYDRTGLAPTVTCPECGSQPAEPAPHA